MGAFATGGGGGPDEAARTGRGRRVRRPKAVQFRAALGTVVAASAAPYGYTITTWSSGAILLGLHGVPTIAEVFLFLFGALAGFAVVGAFAHRALASTAPVAPGRGHVLTGLLHWFAVGLAVGAATLVAEVPSWVAWPAGSFLATAVYLTTASFQLAVVTASRAPVATKAPRGDQALP